MKRKLSTSTRAILVTLLLLWSACGFADGAVGVTPRTTLDTSEVTAWPKQNRLETAAPAQLVQGGTRIHGVGMRADLNDKHLELLDDVHATFPPRQRAR